MNYQPPLKPFPILGPLPGSMSGPMSGSGENINDLNNLTKIVRQAQKAGFEFFFLIIFFPTFQLFFPLTKKFFF